MKNLEYFVDSIKDFKSVYLAGGIQHRIRQGWREDLQNYFLKNKIKVFNPVEDNSHIFHPSIMGYKGNGKTYSLSELQDIDELKESILLKQTEINDYYFIKISDLIVFYFDGTENFGTYTEFCWVYEMKKPMIIIRNYPRRKLPHWIKWRRYFYLILEKRAIEFRSFVELKEFFKTYFGFQE